MNVRLTILLAVFCAPLFISACTTPAAPLLAAQMGAQQVGFVIEDKHARGAAALKDEPDLLSFSVKAIEDQTTDEATNTYLKGYSSSDYSDNVKSLALYQVALIKMNRFNTQRDDEQAEYYLHQHLKAFPNSSLKGRIQKHLKTISERKKTGINVSSKQLLKSIDRIELMKKSSIPFDADLTPMSERAITDNRASDAENIYLIVYNNTSSSDELRAKALYQMGLIYMSPFHKQYSSDKALKYLRMLKREFPMASVSEHADQRITWLLNQQN